MQGEHQSKKSVNVEPLATDLELLMTRSYLHGISRFKTQYTRYYRHAIALATLNQTNTEEVPTVVKDYQHLVKEERILSMIRTNLVGNSCRLNQSHMQGAKVGVVLTSL